MDLLCRFVVEALEVSGKFCNSGNLVNSGSSTVDEDCWSATDALLCAVLELLPGSELDSAGIELVGNVSLFEAGHLGGVFLKMLDNLRLAELAKGLVFELLLVSFENLSKEISGLILGQFLDGEDDLGNCVSPGVERKGQHVNGHTDLRNLLDDVLEELPHLIAVGAARISEEGDLDWSVFVTIGETLKAPWDWHHSGSGR